jgi:hypothetical protein
MAAVNEVAVIAPTPGIAIIDPAPIVLAHAA